MDKISKICEVVSIEEIDDDGGDVYNLHIQDNHNYFAGGMLVQNCHLFKAKSLKGIMDKIPDCAFRIGVTGTLDAAKDKQLPVEAVFGKPYRVARTVDLQTQGHLVPIAIQGHFLEYSKYDRWFVREYKRRYADEVDYFVQHPGRMKWLVDFVTQLRGNVLMLYTLVEKHGIPLYHAVKAKVGDTRPVYFVSGNVSGESRERVRGLLEAPEHIIFQFGDTEVRCAPTEKIPLRDGRNKLAQDITLDDDVADSWALNTGREFPKTISTTETATF